MQERGRWITLDNGIHVFLRDGETVKTHFAGKLQKTVPDRFKHGKLIEDSLTKLKEYQDQKYNNNLYTDVTDKWLLEHEQKANIKEDDYVIIDGKKYKMLDPYEDGKPVKYVKGFDNSIEKEDAEIISKQSGGIVHKQPKIDYPKGRKSADYRHEVKGNTYYIDQKHLDKKDTGDMTLWNAIRRSTKQTDTFVVDTRDKKYTNDEIMFQIHNVFTSPYTAKVNRVILIKDGKSIWKIFQRNK